MMNDKWLAEFGEVARKLSSAPLTNEELGRTLEKIFIRMEAESDRDAREEVNKAQANVRGRRDENPQARDCKYIYPEDR
jgi:hypothetical protein